MKERLKSLVAELELAWEIDPMSDRFMDALRELTEFANDLAE